jgi:succinate dehydrogenase / fumarate reductase membrane anchor subunit
MTSQARSYSRGRTGGKFELYAWFFTRITGILFLLMGAFNLAYANLFGGQGNMDVAAQMRWAFFPIPFHVESTSVEVTPNFSNPFWQIYAFILVAFAATHGFNGLRVILEDYVKSPLALAWLRGMLVFIWLFVLLAAIFLIFVYV